MLQRIGMGLRIALAIVALGQIIYADSAIPLLSGFDADRIDAAYPPNEAASLEELAKLVYRLRSLDPNNLRKLSIPDGQPAIGDAVTAEGIIARTETLPVPDKLIEFLEFSRLHLIEIDEEGRTTRIVAAKLPAGAKPGDRIAAVGVAIETPNEVDGVLGGELTIACNSVQWFPKRLGNSGQQLLSEYGFDLGLLSEVAARNRLPLLAEDGDAFYSMLAAASLVADQWELPTPSTADPVALLRDPQSLVGQWVQMDLESVQVTRVTVTEPHRQEQLGSDHYYQIDAVGELEGVVIRIESADGKAPPAMFQDRYPVSLVIRELPDFLQEQIRDQRGGNAIVASLRRKISVNGFFYRLWGYDSDFMKQHGGGQQFGPLLMAVRLQNREPESADPVGVGIIGTIAAVSIVTSMIVIWWWQRRAWAADDEARRRRQEHQSEQVQLPQ